MSDKPTTTTETEKEIIAKLEAYFDPEEIRFRPMNKPNSERTRVVAYIDARCVVERLTQVLGMGWQDSYNVMPGDSVQCQLSIRVGGEWIQRVDVGSPSEQPDKGDRMKAAHSDALKRAAVKFGVGLYLYQMPALFAKWDVKAGRMIEPPAVPDWAIPPDLKPAGGKMADSLIALAREACGRSGHDVGKWQAQVLTELGYKPDRPLASIQKRHASATMKRLNDWIGELARSEAANPPPQSGKELYAKLKTWEDGLTAGKRCAPGQLMAYVLATGAKGNFGANMDGWNKDAVARAWAAAHEFVASIVDNGKAPKNQTRTQ